MTALPQIIDQVYPTISIQINPAQRRFLGTLARIAGCTPETMASTMLGQSLEIEAAQVIDSLSNGITTASFADALTPEKGEPNLTGNGQAGDFLSFEEAEDAARTHVEILGQE